MIQREGHAHIIQFLIESGADVTKKDYKDRYPFYLDEPFLLNRNVLEMAIEKGKRKVGCSNERIR